MNIEHIVLMNLRRREDKYWFALGTLSVLGFDCSPTSGQVIRFITHDGLDYPDAKSVHDAAVADGFPEFAEFQFERRSRVAWMWSWRCALRRIVEMGNMVLLLIDDHLPTWNFTYIRFRELVNSCRYEDPDVRIIQLYHVEVPHHPVALMKPKPRGAILEKGLSGWGDVALILSPEGARLLLEMSSKPPYSDPPDEFLKLIALQHDENYSWGIWHTIDNAVDCNHRWDSDLDY